MFFSTFVFQSRSVSVYTHRRSFCFWACSRAHKLRRRGFGRIPQLVVAFNFRLIWIGSPSLFLAVFCQTTHDALPAAGPAHIRGGRFDCIASYIQVRAPVLRLGMHMFQFLISFSPRGLPRSMPAPLLPIVDLLGTQPSRHCAFLALSNPSQHLNQDISYSKGRCQRNAGQINMRL